MKKYCHLLFCSLLLLGLSTACSEDDSYYYPPVKLEFLTAQSDRDGNLKSVVTDEGRKYQVVEDDSNTKIDENSSLRIVSNYGLMKNASGVDGVKLYGVMNAISVDPKAFKEEDAKTDPAELLSGWMGHGYLNLIFEIMVQNGKHKFHFIEDEVEFDDASRHAEVKLTLYHDDDDDVQAYSRRAYLSVPLRKYLNAGLNKITVTFRWHTHSNGVKSQTYEYMPPR